ncbi:MAG TPA: VWA domain-containing protein [Deinococcales bacterium]|nr:VWA domain-containing protein [Deinococcales bacterium]
MSFTTPLALLGLLLLPLLVLLYRQAMRRPASSAFLHPHAALIAQAARSARPWRRHLPAAAYLAALAVAGVAAARPVAPVPVPDNRTTVMLVLDVSLSMRAEDIAPTRFDAAKKAAAEFVRALPDGSPVGLASFNEVAFLNVAPTTDHQAVIDGLDTLYMGYGTAIGAGLLEGVLALPGRGDGETSSKASDLPPAAIVLLSDGRNNRPQVDPMEAAAIAKDQAVKVYTVGLGTEGGFLNRGFDGVGGFVVGFDAETLRRIAETTGGKYFEARSASQLSSIYQGLGRSIGWTYKPREVTNLVSGAAGVLLLLSLGLALLRRKLL